MKHRIKVEYRTGNSFGSHDETDYLDEVWANLDMAKKSLKAIEEHYHLYMLFKKEWNVDEKQQEKALADAKKKDWFYQSKKSGESDYWQYSLGITLDDGSIKFISTGMWCGYFETLFVAEIESEESDTKISFR
jgi:hypothetical protein